PLENPFDWISFAGFSLLALYALGAVCHAFPLIATQLQLRQWSAAATPDRELQGVYVSDMSATPLAISNGRVLFPRVLLETLSAEQTKLIVAHERHHHARGDVAFYTALAWIETLLWFNSFVRGQARHCRLAAELDCDRAVTTAAPEMRRTYAQTLLVVLKHSAGSALQCAPAVFSHRAVGEHRMRILNIMKSDADTRKRAPWLAYVTALALVAPLGLAQLARAQSGIGARLHTGSQSFSVCVRSCCVLASPARWTHHRQLRRSTRRVHW
ncbi:MAG: M56 family metallopeptidase, partial [Terricaulis sp.]